MTEEQNNNQTEPQNDWQAKAQEYLDGWKRAQADLINFKKEEAKRIAEVLKFGNESLVLEILDVLDNLETALAHSPPEVRESQKQWLAGVEQVAKNGQELLKKYGVERIKTVGEQFNPLYHEAVQADAEGDSVVEEYRAGYTMHDKVIRPARVKVAQSV